MIFQISAQSTADINGKENKYVKLKSGLQFSNISENHLDRSQECKVFGYILLDFSLPMPIL